ncbi:MAG TPA: hypothetical protein VIX87_02835 [Steroidobacteraceae bacterium]
MPRSHEAKSDAHDRSAADAAMSKLHISNLYEDAYFGIAEYSSRWTRSIQD